MARTIRGHPGIGPRVTGEALAARDDFSARYDLDRIRGVFSRPAHKLHGESYVGRILVLNYRQGRRGDFLDAARDARARHGSGGPAAQPCEPDHGPGRGVRRPGVHGSLRMRRHGTIATGDRVTVDPEAGKVTIAVIPAKPENDH